MTLSYMALSANQIGRVLSLVKRRNFSHSWKKSQIFNRDSCKNLLIYFWKIVFYVSSALLMYCEKLMFHNENCIVTLAIVIYIQLLVTSKTHWWLPPSKWASWLRSYGNWIYNYLYNKCLFMARYTWCNLMWSSLSVACGRSVVFAGYFGYTHQ
jgi:hypothetical protein